MVVWLILLALVSVAEARVPPEVGIGENNDTLFADPLFPAIGVRHVRVVVSYDVIARADDELGPRDSLPGRGAGAWRRSRWSRSSTRAATRAGVRSTRAGRSAGSRPRPSTSARSSPSASGSRTCARTRRGTSPTTARSRRGTRPRPPRGSPTSRRVTARTARSSSATCSTRPTNRLARRPTYRATTRWIQRYRAALRTPRDVCGIHNYSDVNRFRTAGTRALMRRARLPPVLAHRDRRDHVRRAAGRATASARRARPRFLFRLVAREPRIARVYVYTWFGRVTPQWDSGLVARRADGTTTPRPALDDRARARPGRRAAADHDRERDRGAGARGAAVVGRDPDARGALPEPGAGGGAAGHGGFAPPMLTYALQRGGWTAAAGRAWPMSVRPVTGEPVRHDRRRVRHARVRRAAGRVHGGVRAEVHRRLQQPASWSRRWRRSR